MAWQNPITTWGLAGQTVPGATDFNRIEGNTQELKDLLTDHEEDDAIHQSAEEIRVAADKPLRAEVKSSAPSNPENGQIWYDLVNHKFKGYADGAWV